jgi:hypothetical protein
VISTVAARVEQITVSKLYGPLVGYEQRQELHGKDYSMANTASRGCGSPPTCGGFGHGRGPGNYNSSTNCVECQLCGKKGHTMLKCFKRFDHACTDEDKIASAAVMSYDVDNN